MYCASIKMRSVKNKYHGNVISIINIWDMIRLGRYINQWLVTLDQEKPMMRSTASLVMLCSLFVFSFAQPTAPAYENLNAVLCRLPSNIRRVRCKPTV